MDGLIGEACRRATERRVAHYREEFAGVTSLRELLAVGCRIRTAEQAEGNAPSLSRAVSAAFVGLELCEGVDPADVSTALDALEQLGTLVDLIEDLGPPARRAVCARVRRGDGA